MCFTWSILTNTLLCVIEEPDPTMKTNYNRGKVNMGTSLF